MIYAIQALMWWRKIFNYVDTNTHKAAQSNESIKSLNPMQLPRFHFTYPTHILVYLLILYLQHRRNTSAIVSVLTCWSGLILCDSISNIPKSGSSK